MGVDWLVCWFVGWLLGSLVGCVVVVVVQTIESARVSVQARAYVQSVQKGSTGCQCHHVAENGRLTQQRQVPGVRRT